MRRARDARRTHGQVRRDMLDMAAFCKREGFKPGRPSGDWVTVGRCPFHDDTDPSLRANMRTGRMRCMACGWSGDPIDYAQKRHGLRFIDAAKRAGLWGGAL